MGALSDALTRSVVVILWPRSDVSASAGCDLVCSGLIRQCQLYGHRRDNADGVSMIILYKTTYVD